MHKPCLLRFHCKLPLCTPPRQAGFRQQPAHPKRPRAGTHIGKRRGRATSAPPSPGTAGGPAGTAAPHCSPHPAQNGEPKYNTVCADGGNGSGNIRRLEQQPLIRLHSSSCKEGGRDDTGLIPFVWRVTAALIQWTRGTSLRPRLEDTARVNTLLYATRLLPWCAAFGCNLPHNPPSPCCRGCSQHVRRPKKTSFKDQPYPWAQPSLPALTMLPRLLQQQVSCRLRALGPAHWPPSAAPGHRAAQAARSMREGIVDEVSRQHEHDGTIGSHPATLSRCARGRVTWLKQRHLQLPKLHHRAAAATTTLACRWSVELAPRAAATSDSRATGAFRLRRRRLKKAERRTAWLEGRPGSGEGERLGRLADAAPAAPAASAAPAAPAPADVDAAPAVGRCCGMAVVSMQPAASATAGSTATHCASQSSWQTTARSWLVRAELVRCQNGGCWGTMFRPPLTY